MSAILILLPICVFQEVSAFGEEGEGDYLDDWTVLCNGPYWVMPVLPAMVHTAPIWGCVGGAQLVKNPPAMQETLARFLGQEDPLEKA